jgi:hypothetical protein
LLTEDYLMRLIRLAVAALAKIVGLKTAGLYQDAQWAADQMIGQIFGLDYEILSRLDDARLLDLLNQYGQLDCDRLSIAADLFAAKGDVYADMGEPDAARFNWQRALSFYLEVVLSGGISQFPTPVDKVETLLARLEPVGDLPVRMRVNLYQYHAQIGQFDRAAAIMAKLLSDPSLRADMLPEAQLFYQQLLGKTDAELAQGGMERTAIQSALNNLYS